MALIEVNVNNSCRHFILLQILILVLTSSVLTACSTVGWHQYLTTSDNKPGLLTDHSGTEMSFMQRPASGRDVLPQDTKAGSQTTGAVSPGLSAKSQAGADVKADAASQTSASTTGVKRMRTVEGLGPANQRRGKDHLQKSRDNLKKLPGNPVEAKEAPQFSILRGWFTRPVDPARDIRRKHEYADSMRGKPTPFRSH